jgi:hypothetical protein
MAVSNVNFVSEFRSIMRYSMQYGLSLRERMLWIALFYIANDRAVYDEQTGAYDWPDDYFAVSNAELGLYCTLDKRGIDTLRNSLKQRGLIDFAKGQRNARNPEYRLNYLSMNVGCKTVPNDIPNHAPNNVPNGVPNKAPLPKYSIEKIDYQKKLGIDNAYRVNERARNKAAQLICDEVISLGLAGATDRMQEAVAYGLSCGMTPNTVMQIAWDNRMYKDCFIPCVMNMRAEDIERLNRDTAEGVPAC